MNKRWYGQQGYPPWNPPQGYPRQGYPPKCDGFAHPQEEYSNNAYGYPTQGYNYPYAQPPHEWMKHNQQPHNTYTQTGGGTHNPQIQGVNEIANKGSINMGTNSGMTNNFDNRGDIANKQIQGVNGSQITM